MPANFDDYMRLVLRGGRPAAAAMTAPTVSNQIPDQLANIPKEAFIEQAPVQETERGVLSKILNALGAGEYAVASFLKALINKGEEDPFGAAWKGFKSGFTDDREYETRMYDILTQVGWEDSPDDPVKNAAKFVSGLALGIVADPLTYLSFGPAARAMRIGSSTLSSWARKAGIDIPKAFLKGQAFTKLGREAQEGLVQKYLREMGEGAHKNYYKVDRATKKAQYHLLDVVRPGGEKSTKKVAGVLEALGREPTEKAVKDFAEGGYKELLDKGGLKWFGRTLWSPATGKGYLTPRAATVSGFLVGERISSNAPLLTRGAEKIKDSSIWKDFISKPFDKLARQFSPTHGMRRDLKQFWHMVNSSGELGSQDLAEAVKNLSTVSDDAIEGLLGGRKLFAGGRGLPTVEKLDRALGEQAKGFMLWSLISMRSRNIPVDGVQEFMESIFNRKPGFETAYKIAKKEFGIDKLPDWQRAGVVVAAKRARRLLEAIKPLSDELGVGFSVAPSYFPRVYNITDDVTDAARQRKFLGNDPMWFQKEQKALIDPLDVPWTSTDKGARTIKKLVEAGELPGQFSKKFDEVMQARLGVLYERAYKRDAIERLLHHAAYDPAALRLLRDLGNDPDWMAVHPEIARAVERLADPAVGAAASDVKTFKDFTRHLSLQQTPEAMDSLVTKFARDVEGMPNLTGENIDTFMSQIDGAIAHKRHMAATSTNKEAWEASAAHLEGLKPQIRGLLEEKGVNNIIGKAQDEIADALRPRPAQMAKLSHEGEQVLREAESAYGGTLAKPTLGDLPPGKAQETLLQRTRAVVKKADRTDAHQALVYASQAGRRIDRDLLDYVAVMEDLNRVVQGRAMATSPSRVMKRSRDLAGRIQKEIHAVQGRFDRLGKSSASEARRGLGGFLYKQELDALLDIQKRLPGRFKQQQLEVLDGFRALMGEANKQGFNSGKYMQAFLKHFGGGKPISGWSKETIDMARGALKELKDPEALKKAKWLMTPPVSPEAADTYRRLNLKGQFLTPDPIFPGKMLKANEDFEIPEEIAQIIERVWSPEDMPKIPKIMGMIQSVTAPFKSLVTVGLWGIPRPAFYIRNLVDVNFRGSLGFGLDWWRSGAQHLGDITRIAAGEEGLLKLRNGVEIPFEQVRQWLGEGAVWRFGYERAGLSGRQKIFKVADYADKLSETGRAGAKVRDIKRGVSDWIEKSHLPSVGRLEGLSKWNMENAATINGLISSLESGVPVEQALKRLRDHLYAYNSLTDFERFYMRSLIPFWNFTSRTIPWSVKIFKQKPWVVASLGRMKDMTFLSEEDEALIPEYVRAYPWMTINKTKKGVKLLSMRNTFSIDAVADIFPPMDLQGFRRWASQLNPILMAPIESIAGRELFFMRDIYPRRYITKQLQTPLMRGTFGSLLNAHEVTYRGKPALAVDGPRWHLLRRLHFSRLFRELDDMSSVVADKLSEDTLMGLITGFKIIEADGERQMQFMQNEAEDAYRQYRRSVKAGDTPEVKRILKEYGLKS